jgi:hypothetical protein
MSRGVSALLNGREGFGSRGVSPKGAAVNSQGYEPLDNRPGTETRAPKGRQKPRRGAGTAAPLGLRWPAHGPGPGVSTPGYEPPPLWG